jgi:hypothetical protein
MVDGWLIYSETIHQPYSNHPSTKNIDGWLMLDVDGWWILPTGTGNGNSWDLWVCFFLKENHRESWDSAVACQTKPL